MNVLYAIPLVSYPSVAIANITNFEVAEDMRLGFQAVSPSVWLSIWEARKGARSESLH
jgi:hypothetical protein